jgi:hypothetical protein
MIKMRDSFVFVVLAGVFLLYGPAAGPAHAAKNYGGFDWEVCEKNVIDRLAEHGVPESDIKALGFVEQHSGGRGGITNVQGVEYWVRLNSCDGRVVIDLTASCRIKQAYTRRGCKIDGLKRY